MSDGAQHDRTAAGARPSTSKAVREQHSSPELTLAAVTSLDTQEARDDHGRPPALQDATPAPPAVEVRRSTRRRKTVSARREGDRIIVLVPSGLSTAVESELVDRMISKLEKADQRRALGNHGDDSELHDRAVRLSQRWLGGTAVPRSVVWVPAMRTRWASCTPDDATIRVSSLLRAVPDYVLDYVLVHELAHLVVPGGHPPEFWELVDRYPRTERAIGFLEAYSRMSSMSTASDTAVG
ncbi:M48 family metallopeptidase [Lolliginicoccus suaedae]|uniref:M48 family metallopeptidase n=1 Tax=Lolliginicoccus suaedae TaxID=2605429 RepID=UPI001658F8CB|nr:YgjP-like metallopeptidase domain-containing protein [Lolliginicoccus suaedae]